MSRGSSFPATPNVSEFSVLWGCERLYSGPLTVWWMVAPGFACELYPGTVYPSESPRVHAGVSLSKNTRLVGLTPRRRCVSNALSTQPPTTWNATSSVGE